MSGMPQEPCEPMSIRLSWREHEADPPLAATCWFEEWPIRHVVVKHVASTEPWGRILGGGLVQRLADATRHGGMPAPGDCRDFIAAMTRQLEASCSRPILCRFREVEPSFFSEPGRPQWGASSADSWEKILFVLPAGAVAFARLMPSGVPDVAQLVLLTAFFPGQTNGWVAPSRAAAGAAARYVQRWAQDLHHTGGRLKPEHADWVPEQDESTGTATLRGRFRFITLKNWGFQPHQDGQLVWLGSVPTRF
jgi:hypothetical protein